MKINIEIEAEHIDWKELVAKINEAISEETTDLSSVDVSYSVCSEDET